MEKMEILILGDGREAVVCAKFAKKNYDDKMVTILVSNYTNFITKVNQFFNYTVKARINKVYKILIDELEINLIVDVVIGRREKTLLLKSGRIINFEKLVFALGCKCPDLHIEGVEKNCVIFLKTNLHLLDRIRQIALKKNKIIIYGGSYIGVKLSDELLRMKKQLLIIENSRCLLPESINPTLGLEVKDLISGLGGEVLFNTSITKVIGNDSIEAVEISDNSIIECDLLLISCKNKPNIDLAQKFGLICDSDRGILVDEYYRTSEEGVFAIGECAARFDFFKGDLFSAILSSTFVLEGSIVGSNLYSTIYNRNRSLEYLYSVSSII
jgi:NADH oxidase (H2O2-forming)